MFLMFFGGCIGGLMDIERLKEAIEKLDSKTHKALREALVTEYNRLIGVTGQAEKCEADVKFAKEPPADFSQCVDEDFEERVAIMEYDGGLDRAEAERRARQASSVIVLKTNE